MFILTNIIGINQNLSKNMRCMEFYGTLMILTVHLIQTRIPDIVPIIRKKITYRLVDFVVPADNRENKRD